MSFLRDLSILWSLLHTLVLFALLFEPRLPRKKALLLTGFTMVPLCLLNSVLYIWLGPAAMGQFLLLTCSLPSLIIFFLMAKHRDGRFIFTFCLVDTLSYWVIVVTSMLDYYLGGNRYILMFIIRLLIFPVFELLLLRCLRAPYLQMQRILKKGWLPFSLISALFYLLLVIFSSYPSLIVERPDDVPAMIIILLLMPLMYFNIFQILQRQQKLYRAEAEKRMLRMQAGMLSQQAERMEQLRRQMRIYRHDERHRLQTAAALITKGEHASALEFLNATQKDLEAVKDVRWCANPILDAVFSSYFLQAQQAGIALEAEISAAENLPVDAAELSTVFANALENAIHACMALPEEKRFIRCKCIASPQFMFRISNAYADEVLFDAAGCPLSADENHGIGSRSIAAFCEKHGAHCEYAAANGVFTLKLMLL